MKADLSIIHLISEASLIVQLVMLLLVIMSLVSWTFIFIKRRQLAGEFKRATQFEDKFWSGGDISKLYADLNKHRNSASGMELIFLSGFKEFGRLRNQPGYDSDSVVESVSRAMRVATTREIDELETKLSFLATVGSTSPYIGLFGTVWGIMNSFRALGTVQVATLQSVAPGIAEALIATAVGLFAAIPAVIAYNKFANQVERLTTSYDTFSDEFVAILQRQLRGQSTRVSEGVPT